MTKAQHSDLKAVNEFLSERMGLFFSEQRLSDLGRGLKEACPELSFARAEDLCQELLSDKFDRNKLRILAQYLTVGETYFFRDPASFLALEESVLPPLLRKKRAAKRLKIWSAGCSSGEEPYSIAISLLRSIPDINNWEIKLLATDINMRSLERAREARYSSWSFRSMPEEFISQYFSEEADGQFSLNEKIKKMVKFDYLNLAEDKYSKSGIPNDLDLIFCRNVLIYFTQAKAKDIAEQLGQCLHPEAYLFTSANDSARFIANPPQNLERAASTIFKKRN
ncbi:MAG: protein-glutamate O-methyltransferase CheR [Candidatus Obscuribacterales bacterium]|nr:protein-glutamate O-methyltransferase CheR [Candidatus Obscuribacterales bacterium]